MPGVAGAVDRGAAATAGSEAEEEPQGCRYDCCDSVAAGAVQCLWQVRSLVPLAGVATYSNHVCGVVQVVLCTLVVWLVAGMSQLNETAAPAALQP